MKLEAETQVQALARKHESTITVLDCKELNKKEMTFLVDISSPSRNAGEVIADLKEEKVFKKVYAGETSGRPSRSLCVAILDRPGLCQAVLESGAFCLSCPYSKSEADGMWRLLVKDSVQLKTLLARLDDLHIRASIGGVSEVKSEGRLTSRQKEILGKAMMLGYFEFPRRISLTELSKHIGIKPSTLSQVLRAAEEKVMAKYASEMNVSKIAYPQNQPFTLGS